ncbi:MAG: hypothetical protein JRI52_03905 [Deltaproteobacteria bacterium]|nr:hypothetical protein [Deltaproteobacteria bacterium]
MVRQLVFDFCEPKRSPLFDALDDSSKEEILQGMAGIIIHYFKRAKEVRDDKGIQSQDNAGSPEQEGDYLCSAIIGKTGTK